MIRPPVGEQNLAKEVGVEPTEHAFARSTGFEVPLLPLTATRYSTPQQSNQRFTAPCLWCEVAVSCAVLARSVP